MQKVLASLIPVLVGFLIAMIPPPCSVDSKGWMLLAIFTATISGLILKPLPMGAVSLIGLLACVMTKTLDLQAQALSGYGHYTVWLIVYVFFIARAFIKTGLGNRIAYFFIRLLGHHTLGLSYGLVLTEVMMAPVIPSNTARSGGVIFPIFKSISESLGSRAGDGTERKVGAFLSLVSLHANLITSAMFLTAMAANPIIQAIAQNQNIEITWMKWAVAASLPGVLSLIIMPLVLYFFYPPELKRVPGAVAVAEKKLTEMGPLKVQEWIMGGVFVMMLVLWIMGNQWGIHSVTTALIGLTILLITDVLSWKDLLEEQEAWNILIWFSILVMMAHHLETFGVVQWFSQEVSLLFSGWSWQVTGLGLLLIYFYSHYFFASSTAHVSAMYGAFLSICIAAGVPPLFAALILGFSSSLYASLTHYGSAPNVIFYGAGYVPMKVFWAFGFLIGTLNLIIWLGVGSMWWSALGLF